MKIQLRTIAANASIVTIGENEIFFSYETAIAFRGRIKANIIKNGAISTQEFRTVRLENIWGKTTAKHFGTLGCKNFDVVSPDEFAAIVSAASR